MDSCTEYAIICFQNETKLVVRLSAPVSSKVLCPSIETAMLLQVMTYLLSLTTHLITSQPKRSRQYGLFSVISFPNDVCDTNIGYNGTCKTLSECIFSGGAVSGGCAKGFGACCYYRTQNCGGDITQNNTHIQNPGFNSAWSARSSYDCTWRIYKSHPNVCAVRLFFETFILSPPRIASLSKFGCLKGDTDVASFSHAGNCYNGVKLCGYNKGHHIYLDMGSSSADPSYAAVTIQLETSTYWAGYARSWNILVSQIECGRPNTPPKGCDQWFWGNHGAGVIVAFNYDNPDTTTIAKLEGEMTVCVRRERGMCRISYVPPDVDDDDHSFSITGSQSLTRGRKGCGKPDAKPATCTDDHIQIPEGSLDGYPLSLRPTPAYPANTESVSFCDRFCGKRLCNTHNQCRKTDHQIVTTRRHPFQIRVLFSEHTQTNKLKGYKLNYWQTKCN